MEQQWGLLTIPGNAVQHLDDTVVGGGRVATIVSQELDIASNYVWMAESAPQISVLSLHLHEQKLEQQLCNIFVTKIL